LLKKKFASIVLFEKQEGFLQAAIVFVLPNFLEGYQADKKLAACA